MIPVVIVGAGPVGLVLALYLDHYGIPCTLVNDESTVCAVPRGNTHNARTMEHYRRLGLAEEVRALGLPADHPTDVAYFTRYGGHELARLPMPSTAQKRAAVRTAAATDQVPEPLHRANQLYVERVLLDRAKARPRVTLRFGCRVTAVRQDADSVTISTEQGDLRSRYVVGCDGARGVVRAAIGAEYRGEGGVDQPVLGGRAIAAHLRVPALRHRVGRAGRAWAYWAITEGFATNLISLDGADEYVLLTSSADAGGVPALVRRAAGADIEVDVLGHRRWTPGVALVADRFADRRVLLAGDAAHLFTPTGGFGMNTGVDDAANLAWKLAAALTGWGGPALLDSYERERRPVALRNTAAARELNRGLAGLAPSAELESDSPEGRRERARVGALLAARGEQFASIGVQLGARYDGSPLVCADGDPPADSLVDYTPSGVPGGRAPHAWCTAGRGPGDSLFDRLGDGFTLLRLGDRPPEAGAFTAAARAAGVPLTVLAVPDPDVRDLYGRDLALVRPDHHIAWRGDRAPDDARAVIAAVTGHQGRTGDAR
ncbi:FAD-dependent monooxygenase [Actinokineospora sp. UTMC 2448]|uniref:FAD-dependent monooxygenase n=1 Tax=Actinokineospora sp. UTMC 2448 TaxID=2268449 RepID=UPI00216443D1|nr:FAD-dependent monooxygenase [Actinokineospora sp. UTMC 2448]UVS81458.1 2,4-dichlorophenol 6-monooxygenase [Actinokineospora sp. UTMC 2448]